MKTPITSIKRLALALCLATPVVSWAAEEVTWDNLSASGTHNQSSTTAAWSLTLTAKSDLPEGSVVKLTNVSICSRNNTISSTDPRYFKVTVGETDYTSEVLNGTGAFSEETLTAGTASYPKLSYDFTDGPSLVVGTTYTFTPLDENSTSGTSFGAKLVQSYDTKSCLIMGGQGGGYYPLGVITGEVVSKIPTYEATVSTETANFSELSWSLNGEAVAVLPDDLTASAILVKMPEGGTLTLDADISTVPTFALTGASPTISCDSTKTYAVTAWDFSEVTGTLTINNNTLTLAENNPILPSSGVTFTGDAVLSLSTFPYASVAQAKTITVTQDIEDSENGLNLTGNKTVVLTGDSEIKRLCLGNNGGVTQTVTLNGGNMTVTGDSAPTSNQASILLGHWGSGASATFNVYNGTFTALNAVSRLGWDGAGTLNVGGQSGSTATVKVVGTTTGTAGGGYSARNGTGTLNINAGGTLELGEGGITMANNVGTLNFKGGTLKATANTTIANNNATKTVVSSNSTIDTQGFDVTVSAPLSGTAQLTKSGSGKLIITGTGTMTGLTAISDGSVEFRGSEAKIGTGSFNISHSGSSLDIIPGEGNTTTLGMQYLINSTWGANDAVDINIGPGSVVYSRDTANSNANGCFAAARVNVLGGGTFEVAYGDAFGWNKTTSISVAEGGKFVVSKRQTLTRMLNLDGGTLEFSDASEDGRGLDFLMLQGSGITVTADSAINAVVAEGEGAVENPLIWIRDGNLPLSVAEDATLTLNASISEPESGNGYVGNGINKTGAGTLTLAKACTSTGTLAVNAGTLKLDGGSWSGPVTVAEGAVLDVVTESELGDGDTIVTLNSASTIAEGAMIKVNGEEVMTSVENGVIKLVVPVTNQYTVTVDGGEPEAFTDFTQALARAASVSGNVVVLTVISGEYNAAWATGSGFVQGTDAEDHVTFTRLATHGNTDVGIFTINDDVMLPAGKSLDDPVAEGSPITYAVAYVLGLLDQGTGDVAELPTPAITIEDGYVTVTLPAGDALTDAYKITCTLLTKASLDDDTWTIVQETDPQAGPVDVKGDIGTGLTVAVDDDAGFYRVKVTIANK